MYLPTAEVADQTKAEIDNGVLRITLPKVSKTQARKIKVESKSTSTKRKSEKTEE